MKRLCLIALVITSILVGCQKNNENDPVLQAKISPVKGVRVSEGRLIFANEAEIIKFAETYANYQPPALDSLEKSIGYLSLRRNLGIDFYDESKTPVESFLLGTVLNPSGIYQVGDSAFYIFKADTSIIVHMLSGVTEKGLLDLKAGDLNQSIIDATDLDIYGEMAKSTTDNCGYCRTTQQDKQIRRADFTYNWQGQTRYVKGIAKMEQIGAVKTLFIQMKSYKGADILVPLADNGRFI